MALLAELASLNPDLHTQEFWDFCAKRELRFQRCLGCGRFRNPPMPGCRHCGDTRSEWIPISGRARVFSYTNVHHPAIPQIAADVPYSVVVVEFDDAPGARLISNLLGARPEQLRIDMPLELVWDEPAAGVVLPRFRPLA